MKLSLYLCVVSCVLGRFGVESKSIKYRIVNRKPRVIKDENGNVMVNSEAVLKRWKEYFEKLMNEENNREPRTEETEVVNEEVNCVSREEVKNALRRMKKDKAVGPDELPIEVWKCMGEMGIEFLTRLFNRLLMGEWMPEE